MPKLRTPLDPRNAKARAGRKRLGLGKPKKRKLLRGKTAVKKHLEDVTKNRPVHPGRNFRVET